MLCMAESMDNAERLSTRFLHLFNTLLTTFYDIEIHKPGKLIPPCLELLCFHLPKTTN